MSLIQSPRRHGSLIRALALPALLWVTGCGPVEPVSAEPSSLAPSASAAGLSAAVRVRNRSTDFDGDGRAELAVFRPSDGKWYVKNVASGATSSIAWGTAGDLPIPADYDGDLRTDYALWRPGDRFFYVKPANGGATFSRGPWGAAGDIPVTGDFDGDRKADLAVYRPSEGNWYILRSSGNWDPASAAARLVLQVGGAQGDVPVPADYDGDGRTDPAVWSESGLWTIKASTEGTRYCILGDGDSDTPVPEDYNGDGRTDCAIWKPDTGSWQYLASPSNSVVASSWGAGYRPYNDMPVTGDFDNDGRADRAVVRRGGAAATDWVISRSIAGTVQSAWGTVTDKALSSTDPEALKAAPLFQAGRVGFYSVDGTSATSLSETTVWQIHSRVRNVQKHYWSGPVVDGSNVDTIAGQVTTKVCDDWMLGRIDAAAFLGWSRGALIVAEVVNRTRTRLNCRKGDVLLPVLGVGLIDTVDRAGIEYANTLPAGVRGHHYVKAKDDIVFQTRHMTGPDLKVSITRRGITHPLLGWDPQTRLDLLTNFQQWFSRVANFEVWPGVDASTRPIVAFRYRRHTSAEAALGPAWWWMSFLTSDPGTSSAIGPGEMAWATIPGKQENFQQLILAFAPGVDTGPILEDVGEEQRDVFLYEGLRFSGQFVVTKVWAPQNAQAFETFLGVVRANPTARIYHNETTNNAMWIINSGPPLNLNFQSLIFNKGGPITGGFLGLRSLALGTLNEQFNPHTLTPVRAYLPLGNDELTRFRPALNAADNLCPSGLEGPWAGGYNPCKP